MKQRNKGASRRARILALSLGVFVIGTSVIPGAGADDSAPSDLPCHLGLDCVPCVSPLTVGYINDNLASALPSTGPLDPIREGLFGFDVVLDNTWGAVGVFQDLGKAWSPDHSSYTHWYWIVSGISMDWDRCVA